jgi:RNA polymerase sigma-70 factor, ECF subfamily
MGAAEGGHARGKRDAVGPPAPCGRAQCVCDACERRFRAMWQMRALVVQSLVRAGAGRSTAEEVVADAFVVAWRKLHDVPIEPDEALRWLCGVARMTLHNERRRARREMRRIERLAQHRARLPSAADHREGDVDEWLTLAQRWRELPTSDAELLLLVGWGGATLDDLARWMQISRGAAAMRLHRARARLAPDR